MRRRVFFITYAHLVDGKLDEPVWREVAWTDAFMDIQGPALPTPRFATQAKIRWDDAYFYVAAKLMEPNVWQVVFSRVFFVCSSACRYAADRRRCVLTGCVQGHADGARLGHLPR